VLKPNKIFSQDLVAIDIDNNWIWGRIMPMSKNNELKNVVVNPIKRGGRLIFEAVELHKTKNTQKLLNVGLKAELLTNKIMIIARGKHLLDYPVTITSLEKLPYWLHMHTNQKREPLLQKNTNTIPRTKLYFVSGISKAKKKHIRKGASS
jgi:hypothetical protein